MKDVGGEDRESARGSPSVEQWLRLALADRDVAAERLLHAGHDALAILLARTPRSARREARDALEDAIAESSMRLLADPEHATRGLRTPTTPLARWLAGLAWNCYRSERRRLDRESHAERDVAAARFAATRDATGEGDDDEGERKGEREHIACIPDEQSPDEDDSETSRGAASGARSADGRSGAFAGRDSRRDLTDRLRRAHLTPKQRAVVELIRAGRPIHEVAHTVGSTPSGVRAQFARARRRAAGRARSMTSGAPWWTRLALLVEPLGRTVDANIYRLRAAGRTIDEIAQALRMAPGAVRGRVNRGAALARRLGLRVE